MSRSMSFVLSQVWMLSLIGCGGDGMVPYYSDRFDPTISGLDVGSEDGNMGGNTVTIQGSGFGASPGEVVVLLGNHNAEVLSVTAEAIAIRTPRGPITGGPVDLVVATVSGYAELKGAYRYEVNTADGSSLYDGQSSYILAENLWTSCLGGLWDHGGTELAGAGCDSVAYVGQAGIDGTAEFYTFSYPRLHSTEIGWVGSSDYSNGGWTFDPSVSAVFPSGIENLRSRIGNFELLNPSENAAGESVCVDPSKSPVDGNTVPCSAESAKEYDLDRMQFCEGFDPESGGNYRYSADWPVAKNFFSSDPGSDLANFEPVDVEVYASSENSSVSLNGATLRLPGAMQVRGESGFNNSAGWSVMGMAACPDGDGDGQALLDEGGVVLSWDPIEDPAELQTDSVAAVGSYVQVSLTYLPIGWFGLQANGPRATLVVSDDADINEETGRAEVAIPNSILYQFPTPNGEWSSSSQITNTGTLGTFESKAGYMILEVYRVTDYRIESGDGSSTIFSYVTGDLSFLDWKNPSDSTDDCADCIDGDGDGWTDARDPDCDEAQGGSGEEESRTSDATCNDGSDNNGDGLIDADDPLCVDGWNGESFCSDGIDNDNDGWSDALDEECQTEDGQELGEDTGSCANGIDDDADGWVDALDPGCLSGAGIEDDEFGGGPCNDGVDNDGHGDVDAADPYCVVNGADADGEAPPSWGPKCADGLDSESGGALDGYVDENDPDCELSTREYSSSFDVDDKPWAPACYDGIDNDNDGSTDAEDPSCWRAADFVPDGFLNDEASSYGTGCSDGSDGDSDGWIDGEDPDCVAGDPARQQETGWGTTQCNDGVDNDGDEKIDRDEVFHCKDATRNSESA